MFKLLFAASSAASLLLAAAPAVHAAGLDGASVSIAGYCCTAPVESDRFTNIPSSTVSSATEFPLGSLFALADSSAIPITFDLSTSSLQASWAVSYTAVPGSFNGFVVNFSGAPNILGVTLNAASTVALTDITFTNSSIAVNGASITFTPNSVALFDIVTAPIPEPASYALMLAGIAVLSGVASGRAKRS